MLDDERKFVERGDNDREGVMLQIMTKDEIIFCSTEAIAAKDRVEREARRKGLGLIEEEEACTSTIRSPAAASYVCWAPRVSTTARTSVVWICAVSRGCIMRMLVAQSEHHRQDTGGLERCKRREGVGSKSGNGGGRRRTQVKKKTQGVCSSWGVVSW